MNAPSKPPKAEADNPNLAIWDALAKTDPAHTKPFARAGGFKGTAIKPIWITKRLTEQFGPCGVGWGIGEPRFEVVQGAPGETLVYCTVSCWHGKPENVLYGVGGDHVAVIRSNGNPFFDDEAFKKAFTDAVNNAFKFIGVAADVHMGLFDDNKYVEDTRKDFANGNGREKVPGIHKIKERLGAMMKAGDKVTELEAFRKLVHENRADIKTIRDANHEWWSGDGGDDFEGFGKWMERRYAELTPLEESLAYQLLVSTLNECDNMDELQSWFSKNSSQIEALDGEESRRFTTIYEARESALAVPA